MFNLHLNLRNPYSHFYKSVKYWHGRTPVEHKAWEIEFYRSADVLGFSFELTGAQDHAGLRLALSLVSFNLEFNIYDTRHWDYEEDDYRDDE